MKRKPSAYEENVFINCPFDKDYLPIFDAILFCVHRCGFTLRCALENENTNVIRLHNIISLIKESKYAVHDLSWVTLDAYGNLPRFNMPLELGIFIGAQAFGDKKQCEKEYLVLESQQFRFKQFISDISGQDIKAHEDKTLKVIGHIRDWLSNKQAKILPTATHIFEEYLQFQANQSQLLAQNKWERDELTFLDRSSLVAYWVHNHLP
jgi:hypothetical protein